MKTGSTRVVRCAIYTRVSTDQELEQTSTRSTPSMKRHRPISGAKRTPVGRCYEPNTTTAASPAATAGDHQAGS